jgi:hypothetical protein
MLSGAGNTFRGGNPHRAFRIAAPAIWPESAPRVSGAASERELKIWDNYQTRAQGHLSGKLAGEFADGILA